MAKAPNPDYIAESLWSNVVQIDTVESMEDNPRQHSNRNKLAIHKSLDRFKQLKPIVLASDGKTVIAGNGTLEQARQLGWEYIAVVNSNLEDDEAKAYAIADNRTTDLSVFDGDVVRRTLDNLDNDLADIAGFNEEELNRIFGPPPNAEANHFDQIAQEANSASSEIPNQPMQTGGADVVPATEPFASIIITGPRDQVETCRERLNEIRTETGVESLCEALEKALMAFETKGT